MVQKPIYFSSVRGAVEGTLVDTTKTMNIPCNYKRIFSTLKDKKKTQRIIERKEKKKEEEKNRQMKYY